MELTTNLVVRSSSNTITTDIIARARRHPTSDDWKRWEPRVLARYKGVPARVLIAEMEADGLHVTYVLLQVLHIAWILVGCGG